MGCRGTTAQEGAYMNLFYTVNDAFVPQLGAAICSVCENNREAEDIAFYIGSYNISEANTAQLEALAARYGRRIAFIPIGNLKERLQFSFDTMGWNEIVLARLLVDQMIPEDVDRVLYLDGDTIVVGSLGELWEMDMGGCAVAASIEPTVSKKRKRELGIGGMPYFNAGVLLIDLKAWRSQNIARRILDFYKARQGRLFANDQDAINGALPGEIAVLPPKFNYSNILWNYPYRVLKRINSPAEYVSEEEFCKNYEDIRIIHYLGEDRPWRRGNTHRFSDRYHQYLSMTPWKDTPLEDGWTLYFKAYKAFWIILKPFPMLQYHIMDFLIPIVLKIRKKMRKP